MFITKASFHHSSSLNFSPVKHIRRLSLQRRRSSDISFLKSNNCNFSDPLRRHLELSSNSRKLLKKIVEKCGFNHTLPVVDIESALSFSCQIQLVITLQGADVDATTRHLMATRIAEMNDAQKTDIIDFLTEIAIAAAMENNACKVFECATVELDKALSEENVAMLVALWKRTLTEIIPTMQAMLYPLKAFDASFDIRREILKGFRDRVLLRILDDVHYGLPSLRSMICLVSFATADQSVEFERFSEIADRILGINHEKEVEREEMEKLRKISKTRLSVPHSIGTQRERMYAKKRASTLPSNRRMVHFSGDCTNETTT